MNVFLSWSGQQSKLVAEALRKWLPGVIQSVDPWVSGADIEAGARWHQALSVQLQQCKFGVICLTRENLRSGWLLYEAGALSKSVEDSSVVPYLLGLRKADVDGPLAYFQSVEADAEGTYFLLKAMNAVLPRLGERPLVDNMLRQAFELWWPKLEEVLRSALATQVHSATPAEPRSSEQMIRELVENTRSIAAVVESVSQRLQVPDRAKAPASPLAIEPEVLAATRAVLTKLIDDVEPDIHPTNIAMEQAVEGWRSVVKNPQATLEDLNESLRRAKNLRSYLDR